MAKVENLEKVNRLLREKAEQGEKANVSCIVGYTAKYAIYVHENMEMKLKGQPRPSGLGTYWNPGGPKFLERPARELRGELVKIIRSIYAATKDMGKALYTAGLRLQRESMQQIPVEYGFLRNSAFTRLETKK